jgi:hypothetical protein
MALIYKGANQPPTYLRHLLHAWVPVHHPAVLAHGKDRHVEDAHELPEMLRVVHLNALDDAGCQKFFFLLGVLTGIIIVVVRRRRRSESMMRVAREVKAPYQVEIVGARGEVAEHRGEHELGDEVDPGEGERLGLSRQKSRVRIPFFSFFACLKDRFVTHLDRDLVEHDAERPHDGVEEEEAQRPDVHHQQHGAVALPLDRLLHVHHVLVHDLQHRQLQVSASSPPSSSSSSSSSKHNIILMLR